MLAERNNPPYSPSIRFLSGTGLRCSETTALRRRNKDGRATVRVSRAWKSVSKGEDVKPPKTQKANRIVTCNSRLSTALAALRQRARRSRLA